VVGVGGGGVGGGCPDLAPAQPKTPAPDKAVAPPLLA